MPRDSWRRRLFVRIKRPLSADCVEKLAVEVVVVI
jgi:hypothetical protein